MKKFTFSTLGCITAIGLFVPLGAANAYDANDRIQNNLGGDGASNFSSRTMTARTGTQESWSGSQGAQGPIRSDMMEDRAIENEKVVKQREMYNKLFPLNAEGN